MNFKHTLESLLYHLILCYIYKPIIYSIYHIVREFLN